MTEKIFVTGATGKIGSTLLELLTAKGAQVTAFVRDPSKISAALAGKVTAIKGDTSDLSAFSSALAGHDRLFLLTVNPASEAPLAQAAKTVGIKHIVKISCIFASPDQEWGSLFESHYKAETAVAATGIPFTFLRPIDFQQNIFNSLATIKGQGKLYNNHSQVLLASIDAADIARTAAVILTSPIDHFAGNSYLLTGPEALPWSQVAAIFTKVVGKPLEHVPVDDATLFNTYSSYGIPRSFAWALTNLGQAYRLRLTGNPYVTGSVEHITGVKPTSWEKFFTENKQAFL